MTAMLIAKKQTDDQSHHAVDKDQIWHHSQPGSVSYDACPAIRTKERSCGITEPQPLLSMYNVHNYRKIRGKTVGRGLKRFEECSLDACTHSGDHEVDLLSHLAGVVTDPLEVLDHRDVVCAHVGALLVLVDEDVHTSALCSFSLMKSMILIRSSRMVLSR